MSTLKVIIAGGGTGGHIFPAVAIGHAIQRLWPGAQLLFVGALGKMEMEKVPKEGFTIIGLDIVGFNRSNWLKNITLPIKLIKSRLKAQSIIKDFNPDVVIGVGGFASFPMLNAAQAKGIPTLIQEQNSYAGKSNKILAQQAEAVCVAYENMGKFFPANKLMLTGNPVRKNISGSKVTKEAAMQHFGLKNDMPTLLIVGGSLGAQSINEAIDAGLDKLVAAGLQIIWQTGKPYAEKATQRAKSFGSNVLATAFIQEMEYAYAAADMVVSRAGALAIAELCIAGKPVIFVPYPHAAEDHQTSNAIALVNNQAAQIVKDSEVHQQLIGKILELKDNTTTCTTMANNILKMAITDADERIANKVFDIVKSKKK